MAATAVGLSKDDSALRFYDSTLGKKAVMAVSGVVLFGFVAGHLIGNLQFFEGPEKLNAYGRFLRNMPALLWTTRIMLLLMVLLHIWSSILLAAGKAKARPKGYVRKKAVHSTYASRTMYWSGPIIAAFVVYHLLDFTFGTVNPGFREGDAYGNVVRSFLNPVVSGFYIIAMALLCLHLFHGVWSMFQTLGVHHPRYTPLLRRFAAISSVLIFLGFISIPLSVLTGLKR
jgi:succinate dehydrogenase / fumarate reductase cytochrome b subunit